MDARSFFVDDDTTVPVYVQLREQVLSALARGHVANGERLPSVRDVAAELNVNPNTVNRAYAELERDGVVETRRGRGTYVAQSKTRRRAGPGAVRLAEIAERFVAHARSLGYDVDQIIKSVRTETNRRRQ
ncbi:MAG: GntR family transcriptional regulator [Vulcanimicrobiaceae bacterium]